MAFIRKQIFIFIIISLFLFYLAGCGGTQKPKLVLSEEEWDYGEVHPENIVSHQFILKNEGKKKLIIEMVYSSCACISLDLADKNIAPGEETQLEAIFDPYGYEGTVTKEITIKSNDPESPEKNIILSINVLRVPHPTIEISQQMFDLGVISKEGKEERFVLKFSITNTGDADLIINEMVSEGILSHTLLLPLVIIPGKEQQAEVYLNTSQLSQGLFRKTVRIMTNDPQNEILFLRITGTIEEK